MDKSYYFGGYYLLRPKAISFGADKGKLTQTTSACINEALLDTWIYSWFKSSKKELETVKKKFCIDDEAISQIQHWADQKYESGKLQWIDNFADLETAAEFKNQFFSHLQDVNIYSIYLSATDARALIQSFNGEAEGEFGLRKNLLAGIPEEADSNEQLLGYDLIGVELGGKYHSFYCDNQTSQLLAEFKLTLNENGLFENIEDWSPVVAYLNDEKNFFEPVPWFVAKTKRIV